MIKGYRTAYWYSAIGLDLSVNRLPEQNGYRQLVEYYLFDSESAVRRSPQADVIDRSGSQQRSAHFRRQNPQNRTFGKQKTFGSFRFGSMECSQISDDNQRFYGMGMIFMMKRVGMDDPDSIHFVDMSEHRGTRLIGHEQR